MSEHAGRNKMYLNSNAVTNCTFFKIVIGELIMLFKVDKVFTNLELFSLNCSNCLAICGIKIGSIHFGIFKLLQKTYKGF